MSYDALQIQFIKEELKKHADLLSELFQEDIKRRGLIDSGTLLSSVKGTSFASVSEKGGNVVLSLKFPDYGRFIEIQKHKNRIKTESRSSNESKWRKKQKKKDTSWYSRNAYGALNKLIGSLMYGYSDEVMEKLKLELKGKK